MNAWGLAAPWLLLALPAAAAEDTVLLEPISTASTAVVGDLVLGDRSLAFVDGTRVELEAVAAGNGGDTALKLFRVVAPRPLAPQHRRAICDQDRAVTFVAVAYPPTSPDLPAWQTGEYKLAFFMGERPPVIAHLRDSATGDGLCLWGTWAEVDRPVD